MKKLKLIYNPFSGNKSFKFDLDICITIFQKYGFDVHVFRTIKKGDIDEHISNMQKDYDIVVVSGGDGTINLVINSLLKNNLDIPLGIIPSGTANDFAGYMNLNPNEIEKCCEIIGRTKPQKIDVGYVNGSYFINVCAGGLFANVSQNIDNDFKNMWGNLAYYIKGLEEIPNFHPIPFKITNSKGEVKKENLYMFMVLNSSGCGSFRKISPYASVTDGLFDFVAFKAKPVYEIAVVFMKLLRGEHINDSNVLYFKDNYMKIECLENSEYAMSNIDGEAGPKMPIEIKICHQALSVFGNFKS